jgi:hypothetical protein
LYFIGGMSSDIFTSRSEHGHFFSAIMHSDADKQLGTVIEYEVDDEGISASLSSEVHVLIDFLPILAATTVFSQPKWVTVNNYGCHNAIERVTPLIFKSWYSKCQ